MRNEVPKNGFLEKLGFSYKNNIVLIFDECTSGFRETFGGLHIRTTPDMAIYGKALGTDMQLQAL